MRVADIIRGVLDMLDHADRPVHAHGTIVLGSRPDDQSEQSEQSDHSNDSELVRMRQIAGLLDTDTVASYENEPREKYADVDVVVAGGDDVHKEKHPLDLRGNSISLYQH